MTTQSLADVLYTGPTEPWLVRCENWIDCRARKECEHAELHEYQQCHHYCGIADAMIKCQEPTPKK